MQGKGRSRTTTPDKCCQTCRTWSVWWCWSFQQIGRPKRLACTWRAVRQLPLVSPSRVDYLSIFQWCGSLNTSPNTSSSSSLSLLSPSLPPSLSASFSLTRTRADTEQSLVRKPRSEDYTGSEGPITAATRPVTATQIRGAAMDVSFAGPDNAVA